jgi:hypothetical protein
LGKELAATGTGLDSFTIFFRVFSIEDLKERNRENFDARYLYLSVKQDEK